MAKVLVERPRPGSEERGTPMKGYKKRLRRMMDSGDSPPIREGMTRPYGSGKPFNENLAPLRRFVESRIGRPWDKVHAEICERIDRGNVVQKHILTHLYDYVLTEVILIDGEPCYGSPEWWRGNRYGRRLRDLDLRQICYICPKSGLLKRVPPRRKRQPSGKPKPPAYVRVNDSLQCHYLKGRWELVTLAPLPDDWHRPVCDKQDVVIGKPVKLITAGEARGTYGATVYAVSRRVLGRIEARQYPIPIDFIR